MAYRGMLSQQTAATGTADSPASTAQPAVAPAARLPTITLHAGALLGMSMLELVDAIVNCGALRLPCCH